MQTAKQQSDSLPEYALVDTATARPIELSIDPPQQRQNTSGSWFRAISPTDNSRFFDGYEERGHGCIHWEVDNWPYLAYSAYSRVFVVAGQEFQVAFYPKGTNIADYTSAFLVAHPNEDDIGWSACVYFALVMSNPFNPSIRRVQTFEHRFSAAERRFGMDEFEKYSDLVRCQGPRPVIEQSSLRISAYVRTCPSVNALLQVLFHIRIFRQVVFLSPSHISGDSFCLPESLRHLFTSLQTWSKPADSRVVCDALKFMDSQTSEMLGTRRILNDIIASLRDTTEESPAAGAISILFQATKRYTLTDMSGNRSRAWTKNSASIPASIFEKTVAFDRIPPVLHIHLNRICNNSSGKGGQELAHRFDYPRMLDLQSYASDHADLSHPWIYRLYAVCFHNGKAHQDRYFAWHGNWVTFADGDVQPEHDRDVFDAHLDPSPVNVYMLVYIRDDIYDTILSSDELWSLNSN
ncbi:cysteine proteinase [Linderina pennispora]|uniref:Cysteine proteinase n=1 Tax=Linderina pennispora TaxID=61395 RepID=A0A1Y1W0P9_9FUNG|nr:cysteine proteinase [Linderina pennispora]ORX66885.1 cysteine proteinase [Linderina pennispora]